MGNNNIFTKTLHINIYVFFYVFKLGGYPDLNRERVVPHTIVLPIELYPPKMLISE